MNQLPVKVYGINLLVKLLEDPPADIRVHCPQGAPIRYGVVVERGDVFDADSHYFREMPLEQVVVAFEEDEEEVEGHYFYLAGEEFRVISLDAVILSFSRE